MLYSVNTERDWMLADYAVESMALLAAVELARDHGVETWVSTPHVARLHVVLADDARAMSQRELDDLRTKAAVDRAEEIARQYAEVIDVYRTEAAQLADAADTLWHNDRMVAALRQEQRALADGLLDRLLGFMPTLVAGDPRAELAAPAAAAD